MRPIVYICGPMTGIEDFNYPAFDKAAKEWEDDGWLVLNPTRHFNGNQDAGHTLYMRASFHDLLMASAIALLPGWEGSLGAFAEVVVATRLGLSFYDAETGQLIDVPFE